MEVVCATLPVKLYQNRHPDTSASSVKAYALLGVAIMLEAISIHFNNSTSFWVVFCTIYVLSTICIIANIYHLDSKDTDLEETSVFDRILFFRVYRQLFNESLSAIRGEKKGKKSRSFLKFIFFTCLINIALCVNLGYLSFLGVAASDFLLQLFMVNMGIYFGYYVLMKLKKRRDGDFVVSMTDKSNYLNIDTKVNYCEQMQIFFICKKNKFSGVGF